MSTERYPLSSDRRFHTQDAAMADHVLVSVRAHGS